VKLKSLWPALLWALLIFILCSIPGKDIPSSDWMHLVALDKWVHFGMFAVLVVLMLHASRTLLPGGEWKPKHKWVLFFIAVVYGAFTEMYQHLALEDRYADVYDFLANTLGAIVGVWVYDRYASAFYRRWNNKKTF
jgi:VanZ family protein